MHVRSAEEGNLRERQLSFKVIRLLRERTALGLKNRLQIQEKIKETYAIALTRERGIRDPPGHRQSLRGKSLTCGDNEDRESGIAETFRT